MWSPTYALVAIILGGGGTAALTDNMPVLHGDLKAHAAGMHATAEDAIKGITDALQLVQLEQTRQALRDAYRDRCNTSPEQRAYIDREIERLRALYFALTKREYDPPPCTT